MSRNTQRIDPLGRCWRPFRIRAVFLNVFGATANNKYNYVFLDSCYAQMGECKTMKTQKERRFNQLGVSRCFSVF